MIEHAKIPFPDTNFWIDFYFNECDEITTLIVMGDDVKVPNVLTILPKSLAWQWREMAMLEAATYLEIRRKTGEPDE